MNELSAEIRDLQQRLEVAGVGGGAGAGRPAEAEGPRGRGFSGLSDEEMDHSINEFSQLMGAA